MAKQTVTFSVMNVSGGEASIFPLTEMPSKYSILMQNCYPGESGLVAKIPGYVSVLTEKVAEALTNGFEYANSDGTKQFLLAGGGKIYKDDGGELAELKDDLDTGARFYFSQINDIVIITNGVDAPLKYDGTTVTALGGSPPTTAIKSHIHKNRVWMIDATDKMLATCSALNTPEAYTGTGSGYIDFKFVLAHGDELVDIVSYVDLLVFIFKNHIAIYSGSNPVGVDSDFQLVQLIDGVGAVGTGVTVTLGTDLAILTPQGVVTLRQTVSTGNLNMGLLSKDIAPTLRLALNSSGGISAVHYKKYGWLLFLIGTTIYGYSYSWKAWFRIVGTDVGGFFTTSADALYITGNGDYYAYDSGWSFNGTNIEMLWEPAWLRIAKGEVNYAYPQVMEMLTRPSLDATIGMQVMYDLKYAMAENITTFKLSSDIPDIDGLQDFDGVDLLDGVLPYELIRVPLFGRGRIMKFRFRNLSTDGPIELAGFSIISKLGR